MKLVQRHVLGICFVFWLYGQRAIDVTLKYDEILERFLKQHEEISNERENEDLMDLLLKAYRDDKSEFKINRIHLKAFLLVSLSLLMRFSLFLPYLACVCIFILGKTIWVKTSLDILLYTIKLHI